MGLWDSIKTGLFGSRPPAINMDDPRFQLQHGGFMGDYTQNALGQRGSFQNVHGANLQQGPQGQFRAGELELMNKLRGISNGNEMGAGEMAVRREAAQGIAAQQASQRMARGAGAATGARAAARGLGDMTVNMEGAAAGAGANDKERAQQLLAGIAGQGRAGDIGLATTQAGLNQQANLANQQAGLEQQGINNQQQLGLLANMLGIDSAQLQAMLQLSGQQQQFGGTQGYLGDILQVGGQLGAAGIMHSDKDLKQDTEDGSDAVQALLDSISPKTYNYKKAAHGKGRHAGVIAQDLEKTPLGKEMVFEAPDGKAVDQRKAISALLASVAHLNRRISKKAA